LRISASLKSAIRNPQSEIVAWGIAMSRYPVFDRTRLRLRPLSERTNDLDVSYWLELDAPAPPFAHPDLPALAARMARARHGGRPVILMMGAHVIRAGVSRHIIDLM